MEINGTIYRILRQEEVTFGDGTKKMKGGFVISCNMDYPHYVAFEMFGEERLSLLNGLAPGMPVRVGFYAESRLGKKGGYYTTLRCFNILALDPVRPTKTENPQPETDELTIPVSPDDDVPF